MIGEHAIQRAAERYGVALLPSELCALEASCRNGRSVLLAKLPHGCEKHLVDHGAISMIAVFDPRNGCIATFLPRSLRSGYQRSCPTGKPRGQQRDRRAVARETREDMGPWPTR